jgi:GntR family transcriptional regulator, transcriptional repressor for pyruvate dehydrogenase complex
MAVEPAGFVPVQRQRAFELILEQLQDKILSGELKAGDKLPNERALAEQLGVGRPSVREALRALEALELIEVRPGIGAASGSTVTERTGHVLPLLLSMHLALGHFSQDEMVETRLIVETFTVRMAAQNRTSAQLAEMASILKELDASRDDRGRYFELDARFHLAIATSSNNRLLAHVMQALRDAMVQQMNTQTDAWDDWDAVLTWAHPDHLELFGAISAKDADRAEAAIRHHLAFYTQR